MKIVGNVLDVIEGRVNSSLLHTVLPNQFRFALGGGTFSDEHSLGEAIVIHHKPYVSWEKHGTLLTETHTPFKTAFLMGVDETPGISCSVDKMQPLSQWYQELAAKYPKGVAVAGKVLFAELYTIYLRKPPIFHKNVNEHHDEYWSKIEMHKDKWVELFGVVAGEQTPDSIKKRAFYENPGETNAQELLSHTHVALLTDTGKVEVVRHLLTHSVVRKGTVELISF